MPEPETVTIVSAGDESYVLGVAVALDSAVRRLNRSLPAHVVVLSAGMSSRSHDTLREMATRWRRGCVLEIMHPVIGRDLPQPAHFSLAAYARLALPLMLPATRRAIYLDADVHVRRDVAGLWQMDLMGAPAAAVADFAFPSLAAGLARMAPALDPNLPYFNTGVLLMDLDRWRAERLGEQIVTWTIGHRDEVRFADQDGINAVLAGRIVELSPQWNVQIGPLEGRRDRDAPRPSGWMTENQPGIGQEPWIVHFVGGKPWTGKGLRFSTSSMAAHMGWHAALCRSRAIGTRRHAALGADVLSTLGRRAAVRLGAGPRWVGARIR